MLAACRHVGTALATSPQPPATKRRRRTRPPPNPGTELWGCSDDSRYRFNEREREKLYRRCGGRPGEHEEDLIEKILELKWTVRECRAIAQAERGAKRERAFSHLEKFERLLMLRDRDLVRATSLREMREKAAGRAPAADIVSDIQSRYGQRR